MSVDVDGLRSAIQNIKLQIAGLEDDVLRLEQIADEAEARPPSPGVSASDTLDLPPGIVVSKPDVVSQFVRAHPGLVKLVHEMATVLLDEFDEERAEIELTLYQDPEIDDRYLVLYVRLPEYDDSLMPRLHAVSERVDSRFSASDEWVLVTTDFRPLA
jgi:hypothetical protein